MKFSKRNLFILGGFLGLLTVSQVGIAGYFHNCQRVRVGNVYIQSCQSGYQPVPWGPPRPWGPPHPWGPVWKQCNTHITPWGTIVKRCAVY